jgi:von Willebrand factor A domain-containing protein 8
METRSHFNDADRRLDRMVACAVMIMESFADMQHKFDYSIVGHDGESPLIPFVEWGAPPKEAAARLQVVEMMFYNALYCGSGDHTLAATQHAIEEVVREEADDYFVVVLSDANLSSYGISAHNLASVLLGDPRVHAFVVFIAGDEKATQLARQLPAGRCHVCVDTARLPIIFRDIFSSTFLAAL